VLQLAELRIYLQRSPGVFLDERHRWSIRAFTYADTGLGDAMMRPISTHIVHEMFEDLQLDRLTFRESRIDTAIVAKELDKGTGLVALRDWVLEPDTEIIAVGDDETDLAMFRVATRSFAPSNILCRSQAKLLGCQIANYPYQRGLLEIVSKIVHPDHDSGCARCADAKKRPVRDKDDIFLSALLAADRTWTANLFSEMRNWKAYTIFTH